MRSTPLAAAVVAFGLLLGACSQNKTKASDVKKDLSEALQEGDAALTKEQADCYAGLIVDKVGAKEINDIQFSKEEPSKELADQLGDVAVTARTSCGIPAAP